MVLWSRLRQSRFKFHAISNGFRSFYSLNPAQVIANQHIYSRKSVPILNYPKFILEDEQLAVFRNIRFYAKPVKVMQNKVERDRDDGEHRMNEDIVAPMVRLVIDAENHCIIPRHEALARARSLKLDLVEVDKNGKPPVCKIFDYNKQKYIQQTKEKERTKSKVILRPGSAKEIRFGGKIKQNDLKIKADMVKRLLEKGYRVKCTVADNDESVDLKAVLSKFTALIDDVAVDEGGPKYEKKQAYTIVRHVKFGPPKKSGKKASAADDSPPTKEDSDTEPPTKKSDWDTFDGDDDGARLMFEIGNEGTGQLRSSEPKPKPETETPFSAYGNPRRAAAPMRIPVGMNDRGAMNTTNTVHTFPNQGNQSHVGMNASPRTRPGRQVESPARVTPRQGPPNLTDQNAAAKSYGIFSAPKGNAAAAAGNKNPRTTPASPSNMTGQDPPAKSYGIFSVPRSSATNPRTSATSSPAAADNPAQKKYGMFSAEEKEKQTQKR